MLILFHKEECPYCAKVRQFLSDSGVSYVSLVTPNGADSRKILEQLGGKQQVPFLLDTDAGEWLYESADIIDYLEKNYVD
ncbi:glutathione S-transferase N-terminal domain-containing protein [Candidatus Gracilibacteria bacterium]|jgi:glutathione S-transferase|nr:glutathione S-transferase N-terminal domain-containing protein [Candidatus Gracilibacteria bacterium]